MEYISIIPSDLDLSTEHRYLRLPHPRTGPSANPAAFRQRLMSPSVRSTTAVPAIRTIVTRGSESELLETPDMVHWRFDHRRILIHHPVDPLFLVIPVVLSLLASCGGESALFQPLSDLISTVSSSHKFSLTPPFSTAKPVETRNEDISRFLALKPIKRVLRLCCERKVLPGAPPSPPADTEDQSSSKPKKQVYYHPSLDLTLRLLRLKVQHFAREEQFRMFDHLVRSLGRDGLLEPDADAELVQLAKTKAAMDHMGQWLPGSMVSALMESYDFSRLSEHLANLSAASLAASLPPVQASKQEKVTKRKVAPGSRGVEALKKVNTASMSKLTSFFKPKDGVRKKGLIAAGEVG